MLVITFHICSNILLFYIVVLPLSRGWGGKQQRHVVSNKGIVILMHLIIYKHIFYSLSLSLYLNLLA